MLRSGNKKTKSIHFVGIKGVGMTPLAIITKEAGFIVTGSDISDEFITDFPLQKAKITTYNSFSIDHINKNLDLVITTGAHGGFNNEEVKRAKELEIKVLTQGEAVGVFMNGSIFKRKFKGISIAGSHGKTTTTALIATILKCAGFDPSFIIGTSDIPSLGLPGHFGKGEYFIAEADEYATEPNFNKTAKFLWQSPKIILFTNIDLDHPDLYNSIDEVREIFLSFANKLSSDGILIANGDDLQIKKLLLDYKGDVITYGFSPNNDYAITRVSTETDCTFFRVSCRGVDIGEFMLNITGEFNALNALGAIIVSLEAGLTINQIRKLLPNFTGSKRRSEYVGKLNSNILLFDDYAHHPTEIKVTLRAFKKRFPKHKIICVFQPHTFSRTKKLLEEFIYSFNDCDLLLITNIYASLREKNNQSITSEQFVQKVANFHKNVVFLPNLNDVVEYIKNNNYKDKTVIVTMGAGDIYKIHDDLKSQNSNLKTTTQNVKLVNFDF